MSFLYAFVILLSCILHLWHTQTLGLGAYIKHAYHTHLSKRRIYALCAPYARTGTLRCLVISQYTFTSRGLLLKLYDINATTKY